MKRRTLVAGSALLIAAAFGVGAYVYTNNTPSVAVVSDTTGLERFHSPVIGPNNAPVTIVEFFDPSCEACRAFYPYVKEILAKYPGKVRVVLRYTPFHKASNEAVRILEAARKQRLFEPVLEALLAAQPSWAADGSPNVQMAWNAAMTAGLDITKAQADARGADVTAVLEQDIADVEKFGVTKTPTFFVDGKPLTEFGPQQLDDAVAKAVAAAG